MDESQIASHIQMTQVYLHLFALNSIDVETAVRELRRWTRNCPQAYSLIPKNSILETRLLSLQEFSDRGEIEFLFVRKLHCCIGGGDFPQQSLQLDDFGIATVTIQNEAGISEFTSFVGLSNWVQLNRLASEITFTWRGEHLSQPQSGRSMEFSLDVTVDDRTTRVTRWLFDANSPQLPGEVMKMIDHTRTIIESVLSRRSTHD